ncbi:hypothetical protein KFK14_13030 [Sphingobium phenoxybenzoativorans]|uniref:Uncharacterized protein n=1 Tax=Sphingobium phenoxybenzoativorans TaxID=1592790 RepID=A0A975K364_9SPHN|nr:hypothetical protein [Sphingobium phenoxybenzoativorans]QUT04070.1 hypothetical protein KFK14_13030 [Sphingobium phenoxybenzoativorans]
METTTTIIVDRRDFNGSPIFINGDPIRMPLDTPFEAEATLLEVLTRAKVTYSVVPALTDAQVRRALHKNDLTTADVSLYVSGAERAILTGLREVDIIVDPPIFPDAIEGPGSQWPFYPLPGQLLSSIDGSPLFSSIDGSPLMSTLN